MFFLGASCSFLPYILAAVFAWLFMGYNADAQAEQPVQPDTHNLVVYQQASPAASTSAYHLNWNFTIEEAAELPVVHVVALVECMSHYEPRIMRRASLIPDLRGSPIFI